MALRFVDSFDHYTTVLQKYTAVAGGPTIGAASARTGAQGIRLNGGNFDAFTITIDAQGTWVCGFAVRPGAISQTHLWGSLDAGAYQGQLRLNGDGTLTLFRGNEAAAVATSVLAMSANVYYYVEVKHVIANAGGTLEVRVDGAVWATFTGDTQDTANATANQIRIGRVAGQGANNVDVDDLYILDGTGAAPNNDYWGNTQIEALFPVGAGNYTEWTTLFGAPTHWQAEDEVPPDEDTSYVESATLNQRDTFAMTNLSVVSATIPGIQILMRARTTLAGADNIARMIRHTATDNQGADVALQTSYNYIREILATDPIAAGAWTVANINALEAGARVR